MLTDYDRFEKEDEILEFTTLTPQEYEAFRNQHLSGFYELAEGDGFKKNQSLGC